MVFREKKMKMEFMNPLTKCILGILSVQLYLSEFKDILIIMLTVLDLIKF